MAAKNKKLARVKKHPTIVLCMSDKVEEEVFIKIQMDKELANIIREARKAYKQKDLPEDWGVVFADMISTAMSEVVCENVRNIFKGNTKIGSNAIH